MLFCFVIGVGAARKEGSNAVLEAITLLLNELNREELTKVQAKVTDLLKQ